MEIRLNLKWITLMVTESCNLECKYCYQERKNRSMNKDVIKKTIDFFNKHTDAEKPLIYAFGGEPFLVLNSLEFLFDYAIRKNNKTCFKLITNGTLLNERIKEFLEKYKDFIKIFVVSMDGFKELHDANRVDSNGKGTWDIIVKNLPFFLKTFPDLRVEARFDLDLLRKNYLLKSMENLYSLGIREVSFAPVVQTLTQDTYNSFKQESLVICGWLYEKFKETNKIIVSQIAREIEKSKKQKKVSFCEAVYSTLFIDPEGTIYPCETSYNESHPGTFGTLDAPDYNKMLLFKKMIFLGYSENKKYFICPLTKKEKDMNFFTNSIDELDFSTQTYIKVLVQGIAKNIKKKLEEEQLDKKIA